MSEQLWGLLHFIVREDNWGWGGVGRSHQWRTPRWSLWRRHTAWNMMRKICRTNAARILWSEPRDKGACMLSRVIYLTLVNQSYQRAGRWRGIGTIDTGPSYTPECVQVTRRAPHWSIYTTPAFAYRLTSVGDAGQTVSQRWADVSRFLVPGSLYRLPIPRTRRELNIGWMLGNSFRCRPGI